MAMADYRLCDVCGGKAFYDAGLDYDGTPNTPYRVCGHEQYPENIKEGASLGYLGDWAVICTSCSRKFITMIVERKD